MKKHHSIGEQSKALVGLRLALQCQHWKEAPHFEWANITGNSDRRVPLGGTGLHTRAMYFLYFV
jgi:hypothetical protein